MNTTLETIKNAYAIEQGYEYWAELQQATFLEGDEMESHMNEICIRAQKAALEKAAEKAEITCKRKTIDCKQCYGGGCENPIVDRTSITNPENLVR